MKDSGVDFRGFSNKIDERVKQEISFREEHFEYRRIVVNNLVFFTHRSKSKGTDQYYSVTLFEPYSFSNVFVFRLDEGEEGHTNAAMLAYQEVKERYFSSDNLIVKEYIK